MSPACREVLDGLVESVYQSVLEMISTNRSVPKEKVAEAVDRAILSAAEVKELGLIDEVAHRDHFWEDVKADLDVKKVKLLKNYGQKSLQLDTQNPFALFRVLIEAFSPPAKRSSPRPKIAIVYANGMIMSGKSQASPFGGQVTMGSETMVEAIKTAADDATVKAIVLRIDSPGGSGTASDAIWRAVVEAKAKKPVVASMADVAASGGYYIAMGTSRIVAEPETITGSIGVVSALINMKGTLDLLGIHPERISRGKNAESFSSFADPAKVSMEPLRKVMEGFYWQFVEKAAAGRGKTKDEIHAVAQGRVWTGRDALQKGLVDELGGLDRALQTARELAGVSAEEKLETLELPAPPNIFESLSEAFGMESLARGTGLSAPELRSLAAVPELREALQKAACLLEAARDRVVLLMPFEVKVLRR
jgi:protease-4